MPVVAEMYYHLYGGGVEGQKPPIILIHGAGGNHLYWPSELRRLAGYRIYALDLPGHGKSAGRGQQSIPAYAGAIAGWMDALGMHRAVMVGHSMGGAIALSLALDYAERVMGLGLLGSAARLKVNPALLAAVSNKSTFQAALEMLLSWSFSAQAPAELVALAGRRMAETRPSVLYGDLLACDAFDVTARLGKIRIPSLVLCGEQDRMTPLRNAQFLVDRIADARLSSLPGAGHMLMIEQPLAVANLLREFLERISY